jgi:hypothetical protein
MEEITSHLPEPSNPPIEPIPPEIKSSNNKLALYLIIGGVVILAAIILGAVLLSGMDANGTGKVRDIFLIFMSVEFLVVGVALVVLIVQLASLINLLNNEVRPILKSTTETVNTLKGTTQFLSDNMVEPVIKLNEYLAGLKKLLDVINIFK